MTLHNILTTIPARLTVRRHLIGTFAIASVLALPLTARAVEANTCNKSLAPKSQVCGQCEVAGFTGRYVVGLCVPCNF